MTLLVNCSNLPAAHLAVHDGRCVEMGQQVIHHVVILLVPLHHTVVGWNKGPQSVLHQLQVALLLPLTVPLQQRTIIPNVKAPCEGEQGKGDPEEKRCKKQTYSMTVFLLELDLLGSKRQDKQTCMSDHLQPLLRVLGGHRKKR